MLTASQLDLLPLPVLNLFERYHISILEDIARRIANLDYASAAWQAQRLNEAGLLYQDILQRIADISGESESVLRRIFQEAGVKAFRFDNRIYKAAGLQPLPLNLAPNVMEALMVGLRKTQGTLQNLVRSTAVSGQDAFYNATDLAYMQISTGTLDYNTAIRDAVTDVASQGIDVIYYASGHRDKIDVAVRRATLTGVNQTVGEMTIARADDMGVDLVETSAHIGARNKGDVPENHELWQGKVFTRGLDPKNAGKYPDFEKVTGYGTVTGLCGINCRHSFSVFFEGLSERNYDKKTLDEYANKKVTYQGEEMSWYDATQEQRKIERDIREAKRVAAAVEAAGLDAGDEKTVIRQLQAEMRDFVNQTGLNRQYPREQVE
jgi:hypothetical protein